MRGRGVFFSTKGRKSRRLQWGVCHRVTEGTERVFWATWRAAAESGESGAGGHGKSVGHGWAAVFLWVVAGRCGFAGAPLQTIVNLREEIQLNDAESLRTFMNARGLRAVFWRV